MTVRPPDVNASRYDCTLEEASEGVADEAPETWGLGQPCLRLGLRTISGVAEGAAEIIANERQLGGVFRSVEEFARRCELDRNQLTKLAEADAFHSLGLNRREALWQVKAWESLPPLLRNLAPKDDAVSLPQLALEDEVYADYATVGLSLRAHPIGLVRERLQNEGVVTCASLKERDEGRRVSVAGIVLCRQRPGTASGVVFMTLEDESGVANVIVWPDVFEKHRNIVRLSRVQRVYGRIQRDRTGVVTNIIADRIEGLEIAPSGNLVKSRDFR